MGKKILVTGGAGYIGSHMVHYLLSKGYSSSDIIVFDNLVYGHEEYIPKGVTFVKADLCDSNLIEKVFTDYQIDSVIHFAAYAYVGESMTDPGKYFKNNICAGLNLLEAMRKSSCRKIIFSSTCATYGLPKKVPISEDEKENPINPYGESKLMFEKILFWYENIYGIHHICLRYFNAAGAAFGIGENHSPETHLIPLILYAALRKRENIRIFGSDYDTSDGTCIRDYIHVKDLASAHLLALDFLDKKEESRIYNLGTGKGVSVKEVIEAARTITGKNICTVEQERRPGDPAVLVASSEKIEKELCWKPRHDILSILSSAWQWHKKKHG
jgi:UDP-glucose 4-epimerase